MAELAEKVVKDIESVVVSEGLELVHVELTTAGRHRILRIDIDKEGGVTLDDCSLISNQVSALLDVEDPIPGRYELEVSSPGLDRKFHRESDYTKFIGSLVRVRTTEAVGGLHVIVGRLQSYDGAGIVVLDPKTKKQKTYEIPMGIIKETRLEPEF